VTLLLLYNTRHRSHPGARNTLGSGIVPAQLTLNAPTNVSPPKPTSVVLAGLAGGT
jgi:hypothetical protein